MQIISVVSKIIKRKINIKSIIQMLNNINEDDEMILTVLYYIHNANGYKYHNNQPMNLSLEFIQVFFNYNCTNYKIMMEKYKYIIFY